MSFLNDYSITGKSLNFDPEKVSDLLYKQNQNFRIALLINEKIKLKKQLDLEQSLNQEITVPEDKSLLIVDTNNSNYENYSLTTLTPGSDVRDKINIPDTLEGVSKNNPNTAYGEVYKDFTGKSIKKASDEDLKNFELKYSGLLNIDKSSDNNGSSDDNKAKKQAEIKAKNNAFMDKLGGIEGTLKMADAGFNLANGTFTSGLINGYTANDMSGFARGSTGILNAIPETGNPWIDLSKKALSTLITGVDAIGSKTLGNFSTNKEILSEAGGSFNIGDLTEAELIAGSKVGGFDIISGKYKRMLKQLAAARTKMNKISGIMLDTRNWRDLVTGNNDLAANLYQYDKSGINSLKINSLQFKEGGKLDLSEDFEIIEEIIEEVPTFKEGGSIWEFVEETEPWEFIEIEEIESFKNGGEFNVIPEGALHKNLHHMDLEGVTKKGIPVVSEEEGGKIVQQAEIERGEVILRKSVTEKLEKWRKTFESEESSKKEKDEVALKAGKLLVDEILNNTLDNTGILNE